ncbi:hypothetical protein ABG067_003824 [Albugo candida]
MDMPAPLLSGSITYLFFTTSAMVSGIALGISGKLDRETTQIYITLSFMTGLCLWLFWVCCWMHQWHILIAPTYAHE